MVGAPAPADRTGPAHDGRPPLVVACLSVADLRPEVDPLTGSIRHERFGLGLPAPDAAALEHALRLSEAWSGRLVAVAVGPPSIDEVLRQVSALGVGVVRIPSQDGREEGHGPDPATAGLAGDERELARTIAAVIDRWGPPSVVLCGDRSADRGTGALPAYLAHELDAAQALGLVSLHPDPDSPWSAPTLLAERRLDGGWREQLRIRLPAVCSVEGAGVRLRRGSLTGALAAAASPVIEVIAPPAPSVVTAGISRGPVVRVGTTRPYTPRTRVLPPPEGDPRRRLLALTGALVSHEPPTVVGPVGAHQAADELIGFLVRHGYLEQPPEDR